MTHPQKPRAPRFAKKSLGQNFLRDAAAIQRIVASIPEGTPLLLEIGPGRGALSTELFKRAERYVALEKDDQFAAQIGTTLFVHGSRQHHVFHHDALEFEWDRLWQDTGAPADTPLTVAANLPYNVATEILFRLVALRARVPYMVLMFQKEVGQRIAARPGTKDFGIISVLVQNFYEVSVQQILRPGAFVPPPKVDSAVLELRRRAEPLVKLDAATTAEFESLVRAGFAHRRKTLENSLAFETGRLGWVAKAGKEGVRAALAQAGIDPQLRAESLSVADWGRLHGILRRPAD